MSATTISAGALLLLALVHSSLGERRVLQPLFSADWKLRGLSRVVAERLLRFVWHALSLAWVGMALVLIEMPLSLGVGVTMGVPAVALFLGIRGHLAWPVGLVAVVAAFWADGLVTNSLLLVVAFGAAIAMGVAAIVHFYWALGGTRGLDRASPTSDGGKPLRRPGPVITAVVGIALLIFAGLIGAVASGTGGPLPWLVGLGTGVLIVRAVGDGRYVGFSKSVRTTAFAAADDRFFTPLIVFLAFGGIASLLAI